jgi:hypothetical protein
MPCSRRWIAGQYQQEDEIKGQFTCLTPIIARVAAHAKLCACCLHRLAAVLQCMGMAAVPWHAHIHTCLPQQCICPALHGCCKAMTPVPRMQAAGWVLPPNNTRPLPSLGSPQLSCILGVHHRPDMPAISDAGNQLPCCCRHLLDNLRWWAACIASHCMAMTHLSLDACLQHPTSAATRRRCSAACAASCTPGGAAAQPGCMRTTPAGLLH